VTGQREAFSFDGKAALRRAQALTGSLDSSPPNGTRPMSERWNKHFFRLAREVAALSKDPTTRVGAVAVDHDRRILATGYNGLPRGVTDDAERYENRETKLLMVVHAEANIVADAARRGVSLKDCTLYVTHSPYSHCAGLLIQAGVGRIFHPPSSQEFLLRWGPQTKAADLMFRESGVLRLEIA
jgi:dCMP deaminase